MIAVVKSLSMIAVVKSLVICWRRFVADKSLSQVSGILDVKAENQPLSLSFEKEAIKEQTDETDVAKIEELILELSNSSFMITFKRKRQVLVSIKKIKDNCEIKFV